MPRSTIQTSPRLASCFIFRFHLVEHLETENRGSMRRLERILVGLKGQNLLADESTLLMRQSRQLGYDFGRTHVPKVD
jgi:hypothetical protein